MDECATYDDGVIRIFLYRFADEDAASDALAAAPNRIAELHAGLEEYDIADLGDEAFGATSVSPEVRVNDLDNHSRRVIVRSGEYLIDLEVMAINPFPVEPVEEVMSLHLECLAGADCTECRDAADDLFVEE